MTDELQITVSSPDLTPERAYPGDAGLDLKASEDVLIYPGETVAVGTGVCALIPYHFAGFIYSRSGLALKHNIWQANGVGVIDHQYRGEIKSLLYNGGDGAYQVHRGDRIAQLVVLRIELPTVYVMRTALPESTRGDNGFGSSGR
ncbi:MAG: dUTP diphosphatase [Bacteroidales bacterium]|nr:dUTP diphosphatase [Bacteroidales bacterium]